MKKTAFLFIVLICLCVLTMFSACVVFTPPPVPPSPELPAELPPEPPPELPRPALPPAEDVTPRESLLALGYAIAFNIEEHEEADVCGFDLPFSDIEVVLLRDGEPVTQLALIENLLGGAWEYAEEYLTEYIYNPPENVVAGIQAYYAGGGDQVLVSFEPASGTITVWHREFAEMCEGDSIEDSVDPWEAVNKIRLEP